ncbi:MFS transporter [Catenuloplanes indicus]|uniref:MFS family arabinose efflux permease n=1 Tax=Catenuloplanes indicus TaxID=137267 RepID=A0AAE3W5Y6_9ACTN|nr:MFS transporter [Catenuloplanes indicus]MDQ0370104.1 putative MFS family arabinose efflux permease [Catenuloplanes indicus]
MSTTRVAPARIGRLSIGALGVLALALGTLQSVVEPALPLLQRELGVSPSAGALVANSLLITGAIAAPVAGRLGDRYGGRRVLAGLMAMVSAGGLLAATAPNLPMLLLGQLLQGVMIGALPLSFILVRRHLPAGRSQAVIGVVVALFTGGGIVGTAVAGPIAEGLSWQWMFALPTLVIMGATLAVLRLMPDDPPVRAERARRSRTVLPAGAYLLTFVVTASFGMVTFLVPQLFAASGDGYGLGLGTTQIGLLLLPGAIAGVLADSVGGVAARRFGPRAVVVTGAVFTVAAMAGLVLMHDAAWQLALAKAVTAVAAGAGTTALLAGTVSTVDADHTGAATSLLVVTRVAGIAVGAQVAGVILGSGTGEPAFVTGFAVAGAVAALALFSVRTTNREVQQ